MNKTLNLLRRLRDWLMARDMPAETWIPPELWADLPPHHGPCA